MGCAGAARDGGWGYGTGGPGGRGTTVGFDGAGGGGSSAVLSNGVQVLAGGGGGGGGNALQGTLPPCGLAVCNESVGGLGGDGGNPGTSGTSELCAGGQNCGEVTPGCVNCSGSLDDGPGGDNGATPAGAGGGGGAGFAGGSGGQGGPGAGESGAGGGGGLSVVGPSVASPTYLTSRRLGDGQITSTAGSGGSQVFTCGGDAAFTVPADVTQLRVEATAGSGGSPGERQSGRGGLGAVTLATVGVTAGQSLDVVVGCQGSGGAGLGYGEGGFKGIADSPIAADGGGGGGGTAVLAGSDPMVVAGAGGGGGGESSPLEANPGGDGGAGGLPGAQGGNGDGAGSGDGGCTDCGDGITGGDGTGSSFAEAGGGGGGRGGREGGGGGGGGAGGDSTVAQSATGLVFETAPRPGDGSVLLLWIAGASADTSDPATRLDDIAAYTAGFGSASTLATKAAQQARAGHPAAACGLLNAVLAQFRASARRGGIDAAHVQHVADRVAVARSALGCRP